MTLYSLPEISYMNEYFDTFYGGSALLMYGFPCAQQTFRACKLIFPTKPTLNVLPTQGTNDKLHTKQVNHLVNLLAPLNIPIRIYQRTALIVQFRLDNQVPLVGQFKFDIQIPSMSFWRTIHSLHSCGAPSPDPK